jgi:hypothetical protein
MTKDSPFGVDREPVAASAKASHPGSPPLLVFFAAPELAVATIGVTPHHLLIAMERPSAEISRAMDLIDHNGVRPQLLTLDTKVFHYL